MVVNGVFGYGIDTESEKRDAVDALYALLREGGLVIVGYRDLAPDPDIDLSLFDVERFESARLPGLGVTHQRSVHSSMHSFACFSKRPGAWARWESRLVSRRFRYDGVPHVFLTESQLAAREVVRAQLATGALARIEVPCPACGCEDGSTVSTRDMYGLPVRTVLCRACALLYASPRPT
ncbi:MAG: hypothetical protein ACYDCH_11085, partial [Gaiellaceae bacterium]